MRGATDARRRAVCILHNFNPRSSCEERHTATLSGVGAISISIHAPHARSDVSLASRCSKYWNISIHAPHARSDRGYYYYGYISKNFNPRSSCEERLDASQKAADEAAFQSTLLMRGATASRHRMRMRHTSFQSTLLMRGATRGHAHHKLQTQYFNPRSSCEERPPGTARATVRGKISIHAPHARSDVKNWKYV